MYPKCRLHYDGDELKWRDCRVSSIPKRRSERMLLVRKYVPANYHLGHRNQEVQSDVFCDGRQIKGNSPLFRDANDECTQCGKRVTHQYGDSPHQQNPYSVSTFPTRPSCCITQLVRRSIICATSSESLLRAA